MIYTDFKSAFETMPHDLLISVLPSMGIGGKISRWISEFLRDRSFRVRVRDALSRRASASTGCPQGTLLGSVLILMFIDGLRAIVGCPVEYFVFADDVKFVMKVRGEADRDKLQDTLDAFAYWSGRMGLRLSHNKCSVVHFGRHNRHYVYCLGRQELTRQTVVKDLGVSISETLEYVDHIDDVIRRASMIVSWIMRCFVLTSPSAYLKLYNAHVIPIFLYASQVWCPITKGNMERLEKVQNKFLRRVEYRCKLERHSLEIVDLMVRLRKADLRILRKMIKNEELFDEFFTLRPTSTRSGFVLEPHSRAKTDRVRQQFAWRMDKVIRDD